MQSLKSIRLAEVDNFFKQSFEQKKTDSTVYIQAGSHGERGENGMGKKKENII